MNAAPAEVWTHPVVTDPVMGSIGFLNEVMSRYPDAISFAPGAPAPLFIDAFDHEPHIRRYLDHLRHDRGMSDVAARRSLYEYGPSRGLISDLIAAALARDHRIEVPPRAVVVTVGAQEAIFLALRALAGTGDHIAVAHPCFPGVLGAARVLGLTVVPIDVTASGPDLRLLDDACGRAESEGVRLRVCYAAPDYANPSGTRMPLSARRDLLSLAHERGFVVLEDNAYGFTVDDADEFAPLKALDDRTSVVHVGTFAKIGVPGLRVGFAVADQPVRGGGLLGDHLATLKSMVTVNTAPLAQAVVGGLLLQHGVSLRALGREKGAFYRRNLRLLLAELDARMPRAPGTSWERPAGGFFVRVKLPVAADEALLERSASRFGVLWTPMSGFHLDAEGDRVMRLSCSYLDDEQIRSGVARLAALVREVA
ncbi:PLP-dependent aminotransferase family protein [Streptomyces anulatus]|uniref:aminotransferase-like domain-containing protein n=1 Tax=Streptomyces anulatus TaxID=1892 RepID=UPI00341CE9AD